MIRLIFLILLTLFCIAIFVAAQTAVDPRWFDDDPSNDPDDPNYCFTIWNCQTADDWTRGWHAWRRDNGLSHDPARLACVQIVLTSTPAPIGMRVTEEAPTVIERCNPPLRVPPSDNLCHTVWNCQTESDWQRGYMRLKTIMFPPATAVPVVTILPPAGQTGPTEETSASATARPATNTPAPDATMTPTPTATVPAHDHEHLHDGGTFIGVHGHPHEHTCDPLHPEHHHLHNGVNPCPLLPIDTPTPTDTPEPMPQPHVMGHSHAHAGLELCGPFVNPEEAEGRTCVHAHAHGHNCGEHDADYDVTNPHGHPDFVLHRDVPDGGTTVGDTSMHCHSNGRGFDYSDAAAHSSELSAHDGMVHRAVHTALARPTIEATTIVEIRETLVPNILCQLLPTQAPNRPDDCPTATPAAS